MIPLVQKVGGKARAMMLTAKVQQSANGQSASPHLSLRNDELHHKQRREDVLQHGALAAARIS